MDSSIHPAMFHLRVATPLALLLGMLLFGSTMGDDRSTGDRPRLRVLSYNIHHAEGVDGRLDLPRIAGIISSVRPDLVALQEVDQNTQRTHGVDQPAELARLTGMHFAFGGNLNLQGGWYGNAVLSRWPAKKQSNHLLPTVDRGEQRGVLELEFELPAPPAARFRFFATHLDHRAADAERLGSAARINERLAAEPQLPAILAGDLNDLPDSPTLRRFESVWSRANREILPTIPVSRPSRQIDFILLHPASQWRVIDVRVLDEAMASDHRPIFAELEWLAAK